jgi:quinol monooxygenase YgiN
MKHVLIIHRVKDFTAWKRVFHDAANMRKEAGEVSFQVLKYQDEPDKIVHFSEWKSLTSARAFFESPKLVEIRKQAGVESPEFIYLEELERGVL